MNININSNSFELLKNSSDSINNSIRNFTFYKGRTFILLSIFTGAVLLAHTIWKRKDLFFCFNSNKSIPPSNDLNKSIPPSNDLNKSIPPSNDSNNSTAPHNTPSDNPISNSNFVDLEKLKNYLNENKNLNFTDNSVSGCMTF